MSTPPAGQPKASTSAASPNQPASSSENAPRNIPGARNPATGQNQGFPEFEVQGDDTRNAGDDDWEDEVIIERSPRGNAPHRSILHNRNSREHSADSAPADLMHNSPRRPRSVSFKDGNGSDGRGSSHHTNRSIKDFLTRHLNIDQPSSADTAQPGPTSPSVRNPTSSHYHPHFLEPDNSLLEGGYDDVGLSRPESPDKYAFGFSFPNAAGKSGPEAPIAVSGVKAPTTTNAPTEPAINAEPNPNIGSSSAVQPSKFLIETIPPTISNPLSPLATPTPDPNPTRSRRNNNTGMSQRRGSNPLETRESTFTSANPLPPPSPPREQFLTADANRVADDRKRRAQYISEQRRAGGSGSKPGEVNQNQAGPSNEYDPRRPRREAEVPPLRRAQPVGHGPRRSPRQGKGRRRADVPYRPLDPYAFPIGRRKSPIPPLVAAVRWAVEWAEDKVGLGDESDGESSKGSKGSKAEKGKGNGDVIPLMETASARRRAEEAREEEERRRLESTKQVLRQESAELDANFEEAEKARLEAERQELEHGLPTVPRTSPTLAAGRPPGPGPYGDGTESAPSGRLPISSGRPNVGGNTGGGHAMEGTLSPPKASPDTRPASDPGSPPNKRPSPFNLNKLPLPFRNLPKLPIPVIEAEKQMELTLREWVGFAAVQVYRHFLLRLPSLYFNRVGRVFLEADISAKEVELLVNRGTAAGPDSVEARVLDRRSPFRGFGGISVMEDESEPLLGVHHDSSSPSPNMNYKILGELGEYHSDVEGGSMFRGGSMAEGGAAHAQNDAALTESLKRVERFRFEWESFVDGLIKEWKTLNVVSALLLSALLTVFQIQDAAFVPVTRTAALLSLVSAFLSLLFGMIYIIRFSTMRTMRKAARWVAETRKENQKIFWNIWILLSMPVTWLAYSLIFFCIMLMGFIWTSGTGNNASPPDPPISDKSSTILGPRIGITIVFSLGIIYFGLVLNTFRSWSGTSIGPTDTSGELGRHSGETAVDPYGMTPDQTPARRANTALPPIGGVGAAGTVGDRDGLKALAGGNMANENRQQRLGGIMTGLDGRNTGSVGSALQLDLTPPGQALARNLEIPQLTETPPSMEPLVLPPSNGSNAPVTMVTQPTPLSTVDPMRGLNAWDNPLSTNNSPPFQLHQQSLDLDSPLPAVNAPLPAIQEVSEFGSMSRARGGVGPEISMGRVGDGGSVRLVDSQESTMPESARLEEARIEEQKRVEGSEKRGILSRLGRLGK